MEREAHMVFYMVTSPESEKKKAAATTAAMPKTHLRSQYSRRIGYTKSHQIRIQKALEAGREKKRLQSRCHRNCWCLSLQLQKNGENENAFYRYDFEKLVDSCCVKCVRCVHDEKWKYVGNKGKWLAPMKVKRNMRQLTAWIGILEKRLCVCVCVCIVWRKLRNENRLTPKLNWCSPIIQAPTASSGVRMGGRKRMSRIGWGWLWAVW